MAEETDTSPHSIASKNHDRFQSLYEKEIHANARWVLGAAAAGGLACLNGMLSASLRPELVEPLQQGTFGYAFAMVMTYTSLQFREVYYSKVAIFWGSLAGLLGPIEKAKAQNVKLDTSDFVSRTAILLGGLGTLTFTGTTIWVASQIAQTKLAKHTALFYGLS